ncbi:MAG: hypothetical protein ACNA7W_01085 [Pseudomonadales bacterium]
MSKAKANLDWLPAAQAALNADPAFRKLGSADFKLGLVVGGEARLVVFEAFEVAHVAPANPADMRDADIVVEMVPKEWNAYLRQRARARAGSLLSLDVEQRLVKARNPLLRLNLERYNRTLQALLDQGAALAFGSRSSAA